MLQKCVLGGYWKASILEQGSFGLISEAVSPGFDYRDMKIAKPEALQLQFPHLLGILAHREHSFSLSVNSDSCLIVNTDYRLNVNTFPK